MGICIIRIEDDLEEMCEFVLYLHQPSHSFLQLPLVQVNENAFVLLSQVVEDIREVILQADYRLLPARTRSHRVPAQRCSFWEFTVAPNQFLLHSHQCLLQINNLPFCLKCYVIGSNYRLNKQMPQLFDSVAHACEAEVLLVAVLPDVLHQLICLVIAEHHDVLPHQLEAHSLEIVKAELFTQKLAHCILVYHQFLQNRLVCHLVAFLCQERQTLIILWQLWQFDLP
jgi:hypothetical protein